MATEKLKLYELRQVLNGNVKVHITFKGVYKYPTYEGKMKDLSGWQFYSPFSDSIIDSILKEGTIIYIEARNKDFI